MPQTRARRRILETPAVLISPNGRKISSERAVEIFTEAGATDETIFRRWELNEVIAYTRGMGIDIGCGLSKIHSAAIGIDSRLGDKDYFYPLGANIKCSKKDDWLPLSWFSNDSLDFASSSHFLEHISDPSAMISEIWKKLKVDGFMTIVMPDNSVYPALGEPGSNPDHKWDVYPQQMMEIVQRSGIWEVIQFDTLREKMRALSLVEWDEAIARRFGHTTLNFSFDIVCRKVGR